MRSDDPAEAFDALRSEVALLRRAIEGLSAQQPEAPPDFSPTLARIEKATVALGEQVEAMSANPLLALTPELVASQLRSHASLARNEVHGELLTAITSVTKAGGALANLGGRVRTREAQLRWVAYAAGSGALLALVGWLGLSGPIIRSLPASWQIPERVAAATLGQDRWAGGARMMRSADPAAWNRMRSGEDFLLQNRNVIEACSKRAERLQKSVACEVRLGG